MTDVNQPLAARPNLPSAAQPTTWQQIQQQLQRQQAAIIAEIRSYPPPIPACDAQFNYLLEQRTAVRQERRRAEQWEIRHGNSPQQITAFIESSAFVR